MSAMSGTSPGRSLRLGTLIWWPAAGLSFRALARTAHFISNEVTDTASLTFFGDRPSSDLGGDELLDIEVVDVAHRPAVKVWQQPRDEPALDRPVPAPSGAGQGRRRAPHRLW